MTDQPTELETALQIETPCPMSWGSLKGDDTKRYCSECSLFVHNASQLSRQDAQALVAGADSRVCMRFEYDAAGAPIFLDSQRAESASALVQRSRTQQLARWALAAAAGVLAACSGNQSTPPPVAPTADPNGGETTSLMGRVCTMEVLGDVALPERPELMGEAVAVPEPQPEPAVDVPPPSDGE